MEPNSMLNSLPLEDREFLNDFFVSNLLSAHSRLGYVQAMLSWKRCHNRPLAEVGRADVKAWVKYMVENGYSANTISKYAICLRKLYSWILQERGVNEVDAKLKAKSTFSAVPLTALYREITRNHKFSDKLVSEQELKALINHAQHPRLRALIAMLYDGAFRISELTNAKLKDIEWSGDYALIKIRGKTGERRVPLTKSLPYLRAWLQVHPQRGDPEAYIFAVLGGGKVKNLNRD